MNIQEFSHQMRREDHPSKLFRALRSLCGLEVDGLRRSRRIGYEWGVWNEQEPRAHATEPTSR